MVLNLLAKHPRAPPFFFLVVVLFLGLGIHAEVRLTTPPEITDSIMLDDFDDQHIDYKGNYKRKLPISEWPACCGYMINPWGNPAQGFRPSCDSAQKFDGKYSLRLTYTAGAVDEAKLYSPHLNLSKCNAYRMWVWGNNTGKCLKLDIATGGGSHNKLGMFHMIDKEPVFVSFPVEPSMLSDIMEIVWWGEDCMGSQGIFWIDRIQAVKYKTPITDVTIVPATAYGGKTGIQNRKRGSNRVTPKPLSTSSTGTFYGLRGESIRHGARTFGLRCSVQQGETRLLTGQMPRLPH